MKIKFYFLIIFFSLASTYSFAESRCNIFYNKLKNDFSLLELVNTRITTAKTFGFGIQEYFDENLARILYPGDSKYEVGDAANITEVIKINEELSKSYKKKIIYQEGGDWEIDKSKLGYFKVGKIWTQKMASKIKPNDLIISANGKDIRNFELSRNKNEKEIKYFEDFFKKDQEVEFIFQSYDENNIKYTQKIKSKIEEFDYEDPFIDFYIDAISIDEKNSTTNIIIETEFEEVLAEDFPMTKLARDVLVYNRDDGKIWFEECPYSFDEWEDLETINPNYGIKFDNLIYKDSSRFSGNFKIKPVMVGTDDSITEDSLLIQYNTTGEYKFKNEFRLHSFPFDRQQIKIYAYQSNYALGNYQASVSNYPKTRLISLAKKENAIPGWNIIDHNIGYKVFKDPNLSIYNDGIEITLTIERKSSYYIFKVIFPIILILMICWSAVWIDPKEIESRLTITIVCLLSLIAYNFVIDSDMPKLEYLTIMDYIILISYVYAAIPNFLSIYSFQLIKKNKSLAEKYEFYEKRYGLPSYILIIFLIIIINASSSPEHTNSMFAWAAMR